MISTDLPLLTSACAIGAPPAPLPIMTTSNVSHTIHLSFSCTAAKACGPRPRLPAIGLVASERCLLRSPPVEERLAGLRIAGKLLEVGPPRAANVAAVFRVREGTGIRVPPQ